MKRARLVPEDAIPERAELPAPWPGEEVLIGGRRTFLRMTPSTAPDAEPALYIHGLGGSSQNWTDVADLLSDRLIGYAPDLAGFGRSDPPERYTLAALSTQIIQVIEHIGRGPVHLFGNSLGGVVAVRVAATRPDLVRTLTLISPAMPFIDPRWSVQSRFVPFLFFPRVDRLAERRLSQLPPEKVAWLMTSQCWADPYRMPPRRMAEAIEEAARRRQVPWNTAAYVRTFRGLISSFLRAYLPGRDSLWRLAAQVSAPTLVIWGRQDRMINVRLAPRVGRAIPDSRLLIVDRVGHTPQMEVPRIVARAFLGMLEEIETDSRDTAALSA